LKAIGGWDGLAGIAFTLWLCFPFAIKGDGWSATRIIAVNAVMVVVIASLVTIAIATRRRKRVRLDNDANQA
jgi:hypothetical protein